MSQVRDTMALSASYGALLGVAWGANLDDENPLKSWGVPIGVAAGVALPPIVWSLKAAGASVHKCCCVAKKALSIQPRF